MAIVSRWVNRTGDPEVWVNTVVLKWFGTEPWLTARRAPKRTQPVAPYREEAFQD